MISALAACLGGLLWFGRVGSYTPAMGAGYFTLALAAPVMGGTDLSGGKASIFGMVLSTLLLTTMINGLAQIGVSPGGLQIAQAVIAILAVTFSLMARKNST